MNLPNAITIARIVACPVIFALSLSPSVGARYAAFVVFVLAAVSDLWDGYLARKHGQITDTGKLLDPLADKLLLACTFVPLYLVAQRPEALDRVPVWGVLPLWVLVVVFGRELLITLFRTWASRRGVVISAGRSGKRKTLIQNLFIGGLLLWYPLAWTGAEAGWSGWFWSSWSVFHAGWVAATLIVALFMTVYSMLDYLWSYRALVRGRA